MDPVPECYECTYFKELTRPIPDKWEGAIIVKGSDSTTKSYGNDCSGHTEDWKPDQIAEFEKKVVAAVFIRKGTKKGGENGEAILDKIDELFSRGEIHVIGLDHLKKRGGRFKKHHYPHPGPRP